MAGNVQVSIKDEQTARQWLQMVQQINQDYLVAMQEAAQVLEDMQTAADGSLVDEFVSFGSGILTAAEAVFSGIDAIADTVTEVISTVSNFVEEAEGFIRNAVNQIFGR